MRARNGRKLSRSSALSLLPQLPTKWWTNYKRVICSLVDLIPRGLSTATPVRLCSQLLRTDRLTCGCRKWRKMVDIVYMNFSKAKTFPFKIGCSLGRGLNLIASYVERRFITIHVELVFRHWRLYHSTVTFCLNCFLQYIVRKPNVVKSFENKKLRMYNVAPVFWILAGIHAKDRRFPITPSKWPIQKIDLTVRIPCGQSFLWCRYHPEFLGRPSFGDQ